MGGSRSPSRRWRSIMRRQSSWSYPVAPTPYASRPMGFHHSSPSSRMLSPGARAGYGGSSNSNQYRVSPNLLGTGALGLPGLNHVDPLVDLTVSNGRMARLAIDCDQPGMRFGGPARVLCPASQAAHEIACRRNSRTRYSDVAQPLEIRSVRVIRAKSDGRRD